MTKNTESGYTLVEVLVALVLLMLVSLPASQIITALIVDYESMNRINATNLAEQAMHKAIESGHMPAAREVIFASGHSYEAEYDLEEDLGITILRIRIYRQGLDKVLAELKHPMWSSTLSQE